MIYPKNEKILIYYIEMQKPENSFLTRVLTMTRKRRMQKRVHAGLYFNFDFKDIETNISMYL